MADKLLFQALYVRHTRSYRFIPRGVDIKGTRGLRGTSQRAHTIEQAGMARVFCRVDMERPRAGCPFNAVKVAGSCASPAGRIGRGELTLTRVYARRIVEGGRAGTAAGNRADKRAQPLDNS